MSPSALSVSFGYSDRQSTREVQREAADQHRRETLQSRLQEMESRRDDSDDRNEGSRVKTKHFLSSGEKIEHLTAQKLSDNRKAPNPGAFL